MILSAFLKVDRSPQWVADMMKNAPGIPYATSQYTDNMTCRRFDHGQSFVLHGGHWIEKAKSGIKITRGKWYLDDFNDIDPESISQSKIELYSLWEKEISGMRKSGAEVKVCFGKVDF